MIPILYESGETAFTSNGLGRLPDCGMCQVTEERNGIFECQFTYPVNGHNYSKIAEGRIIFVTHDETGRAQPFDIYARSEPIDGVVTFYAHHVSYRLGRVILSPFTASNCPEALAAMPSNTYNACPFAFWTDKTTQGAFTVSEPVSIKEILAGRTGSILDVYGKGDYEWDRFAVKLWQNRGGDPGVTIRYGVNMMDYQRDLNYWESYSGCVPFWSNPETGEMITPGIVYAQGYDASNASIIAMDLSGEWEEAPTAAQVKAKAEARISNNQSWLPTDNIRVSFAQLWQTEEYAAVAPLQRVHLCDKVNVIYGPGGVRVNGVQIIRVVWDALLERYDSMDLGTARASFEQMIREEVTDGLLKIVPTKSFLAASIDYATDLIRGGMGGHVVIGTDASGHPNEILIMDTADKATAVNVWRWNLNGLGHSHNGYNGPFNDVAITMDGRINATMITTGELNAALIKAGTMLADRIKGGTLTLGGSNNANGTLKVLDSNGNEIGSINANATTFKIGSTAYNNVGNAVFNGLGFWLDFGNWNTTFETTFIGVTGSYDLPAQTIGFNAKYGTISDNEYWNAEIVPGGFFASHSLRNSDGTFIGRGWQLMPNLLQGWYSPNTFEVDLQNGAMRFTGSKSREVATEQHGNRLLYCYETPSPLFGDVGEGVIAEDGKCYIWIDPVFAQTVTTTQYQVSIQKYGEGECWISERRGDCFIVEGTPGLRFGWEIKAKQRDFDQKRLDRSETPFALPKQEYGENAARHIEEIMKGRLGE